MSDFFDDYLNEIHDKEIAKNLRDLKKEYTTKQDTIYKKAGPKFDMANAWKKDFGKDSVVSTPQEFKDLDNDYKQKAMDMAKPGIEDENKFNELAKKHAPEPKKDLSDPAISASQEVALKKIADEKESARQKFKQQFKSNGKDIGIERE